MEYGNNFWENLGTPAPTALTQPQVKVVSSVPTTTKINVVSKPSASTPANLQGDQPQIAPAQKPASVKTTNYGENFWSNLQGSQANPQPAVSEPVLQNPLPTQVYQPTSTPKEVSSYGEEYWKNLKVTGVNGTHAPVPEPPPLSGTDLIMNALPKDPQSLPEKILNPVAKGLLTIASPFLNYTKDIADTFAENKISQDQANAPIQTIGKQAQPSERMGSTGAFDKTTLQYIGDSAQVALMLYTPTLANKLIQNGFSQELTGQVIKQLAIQGAKEGFSASLPYGVAAALSSGTKDPKEFTKIVLETTAVGTGLGAVTGAGLPGAKYAYNETRSLQTQLAEQGLAPKLEVPITNVSELSQKAINSIENNSVGIKPGGLDRAKQEITNGVKPPVKVRTLEDGSTFIEDGRHHLQAAKEMNIKDYPIEDVTGKYNLEKNMQAGFINPQAIAQDTKAAAINLKDKTVDNLKTLKTEFFDRYAPIEDLIKNSKLSAEANPYIAARNYAGHMGKVENRLDELSKVLTPSKDILPDVKQYALLERYQELSGRGIKKFPGGLTIESINAQKSALEAKLGPEGMQRVQSTLTGIRGYNDQLLQEARDAGIISKETYNSIKVNNEKYVPLQRLDYLAEQGDKLPRGAKSFNVPTQSIIKTIKGSEKAVVDPIESMVRNTYNTVNLVERNKVAQKVADLSSLPEFKDVVIPLQSGQAGNFKNLPVPAGMEKISLFRNGIKEEYAVPKDVGAALKGLNEQSTDLVTKWARKSSAALRAGATSLNVGFIPANAVRDFQTATIVSKVGFTPYDWMKGFVESIKRGEDYKVFLESGGSSGFFEGNKELPKTVSKLTESKGVRVLKTVINPVKLIQTFGETIELAPRLGVFKRSLSKGLSNTEAAFNARNATVDFAKSGNTMKVINQWVPFLNARLQGNVNVISAIKNKPITSALKLTALVGVPVVATYLNNVKNYPEIWNDISTVDKRNNFIIIYGNKVDSKGNPTQAIKIPKGDAKIFANPLENFLNYLNNNDTKSLGQLALEVGSDFSPVDFENNGKFSGRAVLSGILPPAVKGFVEGETNTNLYTGYDIVPKSMINASPREQYDENTSAIAKELGQYLNWSPKKIDNFIGTQFGGLGKQLTRSSTAGDQVSGRFSGAHGGQISQNMAEEAQQAVQEQADKKLEKQRQAAKLLDRMMNEDNQSAIQDYNSIASNDPELAKMIADLKIKKDMGFTSKDYIIEQLQIDNGERSKFLAGQFSKLKTPEEKAALWDDLVNKKLINSKVADQLGKLLNP